MEGEIEGRDCFIVDDLVQSGNTLLECIDYCKKKKSKSLSVYVTHAVFPNESWRKFL